MCFEQKDRLSPEYGDIPRLTYDDTTLPPPGKAVRAPEVREANSTHQLVSRHVVDIAAYQHGVLVPAIK